MAHISYPNHSQRTLSGEWEVTQVGRNWLDITKYGGKSTKVLGRKRIVVGDCAFDITNYSRIFRGISEGPFKYDSILDITDVQFENPYTIEVTTQRTIAGFKEAPQITRYHLPSEFPRKSNRKSTIIGLLRKLFPWGEFK